MNSSLQGQAAGSRAELDMVTYSLPCLPQVLMGTLLQRDLDQQKQARNRENQFHTQKGKGRQQSPQSDEHLRRFMLNCVPKLMPMLNFMLEIEIIMVALNWLHSHGSGFGNTVTRVTRFKN